MVLVVASSVGWVGAVGTVAAYAMVSRHRLDASSMRFQSINVVGGGLLAVSAVSAGNWPSTVSNLVWASVGVHALVKSRHALRAAVVARLRGLRARRLHGLPGGTPEPGAAPADEIALAA